MKKIAWEAWIDPYHSNAEQFGENTKINASITEFGYKDKEDDEDQPVFGISPNPTIGTPFGLLSVTDDSLASSKFDFWTMHTNFDITVDFIKQLERISGVETIQVFTRYKLRIGFPKTHFFNSADTKNKIQKLIDELNRDTLDKILEVVSQSFNRKISNNVHNIYLNIYNSRFWSIYVYPNGHTDIIISDRHKDFYNKLLIIKDVKTMVGGILINSEEIDHVE
jgi:hypothetical protein